MASLAPHVPEILNFKKYLKNLSSRAKPVYYHTVLITFDRAGYRYIGFALNLPIENAILNKITISTNMYVEFRLRLG